MKLLENEDGDINLPVLALALPVFLMLVAAAIDLARVPLMQRRLQNALAYAAMNAKPVKSAGCTLEAGAFPKDCIPVPPTSPTDDNLIPNSFGSEPFVPAAYGLSTADQDPATELSEAPAQIICPDDETLPTIGSTFFCGLDNSFSKLAVSLAYRQLYSDPFDGWKSGGISISSSVFSLDLSGTGGLPSQDFRIPSTEFSWTNQSSLQEFCAKMVDQFKLPLNFCADVAGVNFAQMFVTSKITHPAGGENIWNLTNSGKPIAWEMEGSCPGDPTGACAEKYLPPAFLVLVGFAQIKAYFGTFALFGGENERWVMEYYILPLQRIYEFSTKYHP